jgi:sec-independent protein translocase protein TatB
MLSLSPAKLLVILVIALIVLGPEKLPQVARQIGAAWHDLRQWRSRIESEVRGAFPDLPPTHEVATIVRSPLAFLDRLADEHEKSKAAEEAEGDEMPGAPLMADPPAAPVSNGNAAGNANAASHGKANANGATGTEGTNGVRIPAGERADGSDAGFHHAVEFDDPSMN